MARWVRRRDVFALPLSLFVLKRALPTPMVSRA
jgi:hypothetical protein